MRIPIGGKPGKLGGMVQKAAAGRHGGKLVKVAAGPMGHKTQTKTPVKTDRGDFQIKG